jgi:hypothetical protein
MTTTAMVAGALSSWEGHPSQIGQKAEARQVQSTCWGLGAVLTTPPHNKFLVTKPHIICEEANVLQEL